MVLLARVVPPGPVWRAMRASARPQARTGSARDDPARACTLTPARDRRWRGLAGGGEVGAGPASVCDQRLGSPPHGGSRPPAGVGSPAWGTASDASAPHPAVAGSPEARVSPSSLQLRGRRHARARWCHHPRRPRTVVSKVDGDAAWSGPPPPRRRGWRTPDAAHASQEPGRGSPPRLRAPARSRPLVPPRGVLARGALRVGPGMSFSTPRQTTPCSTRSPAVQATRLEALAPAASMLGKTRTTGRQI